MKKYFLLFVMSGAILFACNNQKQEKEKTETYRTVPVPNVNGNIPDTTNAIDLKTKHDSTHLKVDSSK